MGKLRLLGLAFCLAVGCNVAQEGAVGQVVFTPENCGRIGGCDFADSIGAGGVIDVWIHGTEGVSTAGFDLASMDPLVFEVAPTADVGSRPTWRMTANHAGTADLVALDRDNLEVDFLAVHVEEVSALRLDEFIGDAVGPTSDQDHDEIWTIDAGADTSFFTTPLGAAESPTMGVFHYGVTADGGLAAGMLAGARLDEGYLYFNVPPGQYSATITNDLGVGIDVLFIAE